MICASRLSARSHSSAHALRAVGYAAPLLLAGCQVPGDGLKAPPIFSGPAAQQAPVELERLLVFPPEDSATISDTLDDFLKFSGSDVVTFASQSAQLGDLAVSVLERQAIWLRTRPDVAIVIEGHSDERVSVPDSFALAEQRANAVRRYFISKGIAATRIRLVAYGKTLPRAEGHSEAAWQLNRRAKTIPIFEPL